MQPAVTNAKVSCTLPVTTKKLQREFLRSIFIGERLIVYGILHQSSRRAITQPQEGSICLTGDLLGAKVEHNIKFQVPLAVTKDNMLQVSTIHHLAAKKLIKRMESDVGSARSKDIIKLSCDSNVISSKTAFIAIDEERKEAVKGSLQRWDILPEDVAYYVEYSEESYDDMGYGLFDDGPTFPSLQTKSRPGNIHHSPGESNASNPLTRIINLQLAWGTWRLTADLADVIGKTTSIIKDACPVSCKGVIETIWATIISLSYLKLRQSRFKDEWELVAVKAETWLAKQSLPQGCSIHVLREKATACLS